MPFRVVLVLIWSFVEKIQTATESFAAPAAAKGERRYDTVAARQHTQQRSDSRKRPTPKTRAVSDHSID